MANILGASSGIQPMSAGLTLLQGMNSVQLGSGLVASSVGLNVGASVRDVQRFASGRSLSVSIDEQQQRLQHYNRLVAGRSLQPFVVTVSASFPIIGLPNSNECAVPTAGNGTGTMCGLGRGMVLLRPGFPGLGSAGIPGMVSSGISNMLSSNGLGLPVSGPAPSGIMHVPRSMIRRPRDVQMLQVPRSLPFTGSLHNAASRVDAKDLDRIDILFRQYAHKDAEGIIGYPDPYPLPDPYTVLFYTKFVQSSTNQSSV